jgi:hypothetical protein
MENLRAINGSWNQTIAILINDLDNVINNIDNGVTINNDTLSIILNQLLDLTNSIDSLDINHNYNITNYSTTVDLSNIENKLDELINKTKEVDTSNIENKLDKLINKKLELTCNIVNQPKKNCNLTPQKPVKRHIPLPEPKPIVKSTKTPVKNDCITPVKDNKKKNTISLIDRNYLTKLNNIRRR